jgi:hypothetical protein
MGDHYEKDGKKYDTENDERIIKQGGKTYREGFFGGWESDKTILGNEKTERDLLGNPKVETDIFGKEKVETNFWGTPIVDPNRSNRDGDNGCFISGACVKSRGLADDCEELMTLRTFRDQDLSKLPEGQSLITEYYEIAPRIVKAIDGTSDAKAIYAEIFERLVMPTVKSVREGDPQNALRLYRRVVRELQNEWLASPPVNVDV